MKYSGVYLYLHTGEPWFDLKNLERYTAYKASQ